MMGIFDLKIESRKPVLIKNNLFTGSITPSLQLKGTGEVPFLTGNLYVDDGKLMLPTGNLLINSGLVQFLQSSPDRPELELTGTAKIKGYDISITISGPYDTPVVMLASTPPLGREELLVLLLTGKRPTSEFDQRIGTQGYSNVTVYLGKNLLNSIFAEYKDETDTSILDRLQLEIGRNITQNGEETIEAQFLLLEGIKNGDNALILTGEKDIWDRYNGGLRLVFKLK